MNATRISAIFLFFLFLSATSNAGILKGTIRDKQGKPVPFASVFIPATTNGTAANASGEYQLSLAPGTYSVNCQSIGYKQVAFKLTVTGNETIDHNFSLQEEGLTMKEVVVRAGTKNEDPAYRIIRQAIKQRVFHLKQVRSFQTTVYMKGVLRTTSVPGSIFGQKVDKSDFGADSNGKGVLYLLEEKADYYSEEPNKERTVVHSVRESGNAQGLGFSQMSSVVTFYENNVRIMDQVAPRGLVSPVSENAISFYKYKLEGEFVENGQIIYKIKVMHRREFEPVFDGTIYIADGDWAIHSLSLTTTDKAGLEYVENLHIEQQFRSLRQDTWVGQSQVLKPALKLLGIGITGNFVWVYSNQKVNETVPDTIFNKRIASTYDKTANKKDTSYWTAERPIPLEADEIKDYHVKDSIAAAPRDTVREDSLRRRGNRVHVMDILYRGKTITGKNNKQSFTINPLIWATNYNTVEGLNVAPGFSYQRKLDTGNRLDVRALLRYGFENRHFNAMAGFTYTHDNREWRTRGWALDVEGGKYVFQYNPQNPVEPILNTFSTLFYNQNYLKLYERWDAAVRFRQSFGNGLRINGKLNYQYRMPMENVSNYSWAKGSVTPVTDNVPDNLKGIYNGNHNALLAHIGLSYSPVFKYVMYPDFKSPQGTNWPTFFASYDKGISGLLDSKVNYDKWRVGFEGDQRLKLFGVLSYNIAAGGFLNDNTVSLPDLMHINGNEYPLASPYMTSFQLAPYYKFSNTEKIYGEAHVEYNLYGLLTNKIPLFRRLNWFFIFGNNTFYAGQDKYYTEAYVSIDNIGYKVYRILRVDLVHSWESNGGEHTGLRASLKLAALIRGPKGRNGQW